MRRVALPFSWKAMVLWWYLGALSSRDWLFKTGSRASSGHTDPDMIRIRLHLQCAFAVWCVGLSLHYPQWTFCSCLRSPSLSNWSHSSLGYSSCQFRLRPPSVFQADHCRCSGIATGSAFNMGQFVKQLASMIDADKSGVRSVDWENGHDLTSRHLVETQTPLPLASL